MAKVKLHKLEVPPSKGIDKHKIMRGISSDKPYYFSSFITHYLSCPKKYKLSLEYPIEQSKAMREGLLFEGYVYGFENPETQKKLEGRMHTETLDKLKAKATHVQKFFKLETCKSFQNVSYENPLFGIGGQKDYEGEVLYNGFWVQCNADLKFTSDIEKYWNYRQNKLDYLQSLIYTYIDFKTGKGIVPFIYFIVENNDFVNPLVKMVKLNFKQSDFDILEEVLNNIHADCFYTANPQDYTCRANYGRCDFMEYCSEGRNYIANNTEIEFSVLH